MNIKTLNKQIKNHSLIIQSIFIHLQHLKSLPNKYPDYKQSNLTTLEIKQLNSLMNNTIKNHKLLTKQYFQIINNNPKIKYRQARKQKIHIKKLFNL